MMTSSPTRIAPPQVRCTPASEPSSDRFDPRSAEALLERVAELLHALGTPAHRLERVLGTVATQLGVEAQFLSTPTSLIFAFGSGEGQRMHMRRVEPGEVDLGKLVEFDEALEDLEDGLATLDETRARVEEVAAAPPRYGALPVTLAFGAASAGASVLFGGGWAELTITFCIGLGIGMLARLLRGEAVRLFEPLSAFLAAAISLTIARTLVPMSDSIVTLSALIVLVPGLTMTVAMIELATRHLVSGTARLAGAMTVFLTIAFGVAMGRALVAMMLPGVSIEEPVVPLSAWMQWLALGLAPLAFAVLFQARLRELPWILAAGWVGIAVSRAGGVELSLELQSFLGALAVGLISNLFARALDRPASVPLMPGILLLVPGSFGYRALDLFLARDAVAGLETGFQAALVAVALVGGLLVSNVLLPPRRSL